ncbi:hypothetical protein KBB27_00375, partial [Patescibacteria group bacterium]|nr:hypothetical protein [Patescibacteria group bacterium]
MDESSERKQKQSIPDQLHACKEFVGRLGLQTVSPAIHEERSAKLSEKWPKLRETLDGISNDAERVGIVIAEQGVILALERWISGVLPPLATKGDDE